jgi:hypothetical protein
MKARRHGPGIDVRLDTHIVCSSRAGGTVRMDSARPSLDLETLYQIDLVQNQADAWLRGQLTQLLVPVPAPEQRLRMAHPAQYSVLRPRNPMQLCSCIVDYARELYFAEGNHYPPDPQLEVWLQKLGERIVERAVAIVAGVDEAGRETAISLEHHGVTEEQMRAAASNEVERLIRTRIAPPPLPPPPAVQDPMPSPPDPQPKIAPPVRTKQRMTGSIHSPRAVARLEKYLQDHGLGAAEFATRAQTTDRTLRSFRSTGKVRRYIFDNIARAMGTTRDDLLGD